MIEEFIEALEFHIRSNARGEMSPQLTLDYIKLEIKEYRRENRIGDDTTDSQKILTPDI